MVFDAVPQPLRLQTLARCWFLGELLCEDSDWRTILLGYVGQEGWPAFEERLRHQAAFLSSSMHLRFTYAFMQWPFKFTRALVFVCY